MKIYNLNCGDMFGRDDRATELYNTKFIPLLKKLGIKKEKDLDNIFSTIREIVEEATSNTDLIARWEEYNGEGV